MQSWSSHGQVSTPLFQHPLCLSSLICLLIVLFIPFIHRQSDQFIIKVHVGCGAGIITWCTFSPGALSLYELKESGINALMQIAKHLQQFLKKQGEYYLPL